MEAIRATTTKSLPKYGNCPEEGGVRGGSKACQNLMEKFIVTTLNEHICF